MPDNDFVFKFVPDRMEDKVQRLAVLYPLTRYCRSLSNVRTNTKRLVKIWRARVHALAKCGWPADATPLHTQYMRNCCPTFTFTEPRTRCCTRQVVCPFCYARWVRDVWERISKSFNPPVTDTPGREFPYHLVEFFCGYVRPYTEDNLDEAAYLQKILNENVAMRKSVVDRLNPLGAMMYDTIEPTKKGWYIRSRHLLKIAPDHVLPAVYGTVPGSSMLRIERPTRKLLLRAVARVCRYPTRLLTGDAAHTALLLDVRQRFSIPMSTHFRSFRSRTF